MNHTSQYLLLGHISKCCHYIVIHNNYSQDGQNWLNFQFNCLSHRVACHLGWWRIDHLENMLHCHCLPCTTPVVSCGNCVTLLWHAYTSQHVCPIRCLINDTFGLWWSGKQHAEVCVNNYVKYTHYSVRILTHKPSTVYNAIRQYMGMFIVGQEGITHLKIDHNVKTPPVARPYEAHKLFETSLWTLQ